MKLTWRIVLRISLLMSVVLAGWAILFHNAVMEEVNDETDDALELFSENLIGRALNGEELPASDNGSNNTYFLEPTTKEYADTNPRISFSDESVFILQKGEQEPSRVLRTLFRDADEGYHLLIVATPTIDANDLRSAITGWIITLYIVLLVLTAGVCLWVLWRSMRPLYVLLRWLDDNDISHGVEPLENPTHINEFIRLNEAIVRSAQRSISLFNQQKQFIGNASHELQTPLSVCQNRLELLAETSLTEEQLGEVIKTLQTLTHLSRLNKELLLLGKIDAGQFLETAQVSVAALVEKSTEDCTLIYESTGITLTYHMEGDVEVAMNPTLATIMVSNLIKNAFVHNRTGGSVRIELDSHALRIANSGGEEPLDESQIFERFYQGRKREGSTGLGLALVKAVAELYGFALEYEFAEGTHNFSVKFR